MIRVGITDGHRLAVAVASGAAAAGRRCGCLRPRSVTSGGCGRLHVLIIMRLATAVAERSQVAASRTLKQPSRDVLPRGSFQVQSDWRVRLARLVRTFAHIPGQSSWQRVYLLEWVSVWLHSRCPVWRWRNCQMECIRRRSGSWSLWTAKCRNM